MRNVRDIVRVNVASDARAWAPRGGAPGTSTWDVASSLASIAPPNVDRKRIAALTSSVSSTVSQGVNSAMSKLQ